MKTREIKFRVWDKENLKMVDQPYFFDTYHYSDENRVNQETYRYYEDWRDLEDGRGYECELMQYTGLKDRNGKEIYEGDVIKFKVDFPDQEFDNGIVRWAAGGYWTSQTEDDLEELLSEELDYLEAEVIGNIYENSELLNETVERETKNAETGEAV